MQNAIKSTIFLLLLIFLSLFLINNSVANNLTIENVQFKDRSPATTSVVIQFDISWENSWKTKINHDAIWLTARLYNPSVSPTDKKLCQLTIAGLNPTGTNTGVSSSLEIYVPADKMGAFIRPSNFGVNSTISSAQVQLTVNYGSCGFSETANVMATLFGIETVFVPKGAFYAGDHDTSTASLHEGSADSDPWYIQSASAISTSNASANAYRYVSAGNIGEDATGSSFTLGSSFPKGYSAFYAMKYEITEGQWVQFLNSLPSAAARARRDVTDSAHKNTDTVKLRNTISCSGSPLACSTNRSARAASYLSWMDVSAFLDWAALRPMTELEFEKMARGPLLSEAGEFVWGTTTITAATTLSGSSESGNETVDTTGANANFNNQTLSGGDSANGSEHTQGALRSGIFATGTSTRVSSGASYYGVMDLSGNVAERVVTIGNSYGRSFTGAHGDGYLSTASGYEGNANQADWPGTDAVAERGVTGAAGSGSKGGSWQDTSLQLRISDRSDAANTSTAAASTAGGRGVRTYDGQ